VLASIQLHYGEASIRARFMDYVNRFVRLASRYEEDKTGSTSIGFPSSVFVPATRTTPARLGRGAVFSEDEVVNLAEMSASLGRIEGWRSTSSYVTFRNVRYSLLVLNFNLTRELTMNEIM
jgi:hypothetical protein